MSTGAGYVHESAAFYLIKKVQLFFSLMSGMDYSPEHGTLRNTSETPLEFSGTSQACTQMLFFFFFSKIDKNTSEAGARERVGSERTRVYPACD